MNMMILNDIDVDDADMLIHPSDDNETYDDNENNCDDNNI